MPDVKYVKGQRMVDGVAITPVRRFAYDSVSEPDTPPHIATVWADGAVSCSATCKGWRYNKKCWHCDDAKATYVNTTARVRRGEFMEETQSVRTHEVIRRPIGSVGYTTREINERNAEIRQQNRAERERQEDREEQERRRRRESARRAGAQIFDDSPQRDPSPRYPVRSRRTAAQRQQDADVAAAQTPPPSEQETIVVHGQQEFKRRIIL